MRQIVFAVLAFAATALAQTPGADVQQYIKIADPTFALTQVRVIDGTGAAAREDQTLIVSDGKIQAIQPSSTAIPKDVKIYDEAGHTVFPGIVGMHNHLYYSASIEEQASTGKIAPPGFMVT